MPDFTFKCLWDRGRKWVVYGDSRHTGYTIRNMHLENPRDNKDVNVVDAYNAENYLRTPAELDVMGRMHDAYRDGDKDQLEDLVALAERTFEGSKKVIALYRYAATKL